MTPWEALAAEKARVAGTPAAALVVTLQPSKVWNGYPVPLDAKLIPIQVIDFFNAAPPHHRSDR